MPLRLSYKTGSVSLAECTHAIGAPRELDEAERKDYVTSLDVVHAIIECLSGGQNPLLGPRRDRFWSSSIPQDHSYDYKEFLYE